MKTFRRYIAALLSCGMIVAGLVGCSERLHAPELPAVESDPIPAAITIDADEVAGVWTAVQGNDTYQLELTAPADGEAVLNHFFVSAVSQMPDSVTNLSYSYTLTDGVFVFTPSTAAARQGASPIRGIYLGNRQIALFVEHAEYTNQICTLTYAHGPVPVITNVSKTRPLAGETVRISGRNLQSVDHVYLPVADGWKEVPQPEIGSQLISFVVPAGEYIQGSVRCQASTEKVSVYSPAYMFATSGVMMHSFNEWGTSKSDHYAGTEFEFTINDLGQLRSNVQYCSAANLPAGHSLSGSSVQSPDSMLSFFGAAPIDWPVASGSDDKKGYVRFSTGDRLAAALTRYEQMNNAPVIAATVCDNLAIQMDLYAVTDGKAEWSTGYISYRLNKDRNGTGDGSVANVAGWEQGQPMSFADGWQTYTIPLSAFSMTKSQTLRQLINTLIDGNLQTILTVMNFTLDADHPAQAVNAFQMSVANIRLVPINTPANTAE